MKKKYIKIETPIRKVKVANSWNALSADDFIKLTALLSLHASGQATPGEVQFMYACHTLGVDPGKIKQTDTIGNLLIIAEQIDFIFDNKGKPTVIFAAQLIPSVRINGKKIKGYQISTEFETLTTDLTASQLTDALEVVKGGVNKLPLLAAILYPGGKYESQAAHRRAHTFEALDALTLQAIAVNFQAFIGFIFTKTHFSILQGRPTGRSEIATGLTETLYNLCADGLGNIEDVKQLSMIEFLTVLRKKLIESINAMHAAEISISEIAQQTGIKSKIIKQIING